jgi:hypothetical protein
MRPECLRAVLQRQRGPIYMLPGGMPRQLDSPPRMQDPFEYPPADCGGGAPPPSSPPSDCDPSSVLSNQVSFAKRRMEKEMMSINKESSPHSLSVAVSHC